MNNKGRKPLSEKSTAPTPMTADELFGNALKIDDELQQELDAQGLEGHWVDYKKLVEFAGYHKNGWQPYKRKNSDTMSNAGFVYGNDPDGLVRRGTVVLAVKPKEKVDQHRNFLKTRATTYGAQVNKQKAQELREHFKRGGINAAVTEGFEENE